MSASNIEVDEFIAMCLREGYIREDEKGGRDFTQAGRKLFNVPDDKSLLDLGLEALVDEVVTEMMTDQARRSFPEKPQ